MDSLPVFFEQRLVGEFRREKVGVSFAYDPKWVALQGAFPISTTMPLARRPYGAKVATPWVMNLLPEEDNLATLLSSLKLANTDFLEIMQRVGRDTAGALSIGQPAPISAGEWRRVETEKEMERIVNELPRKPFLIDDEGVSISLAGAQSKMGVFLDADGTIAIPFNGAPSTHILKPNDTKRLYGIVYDEAFCMTLARMVGLHAPDVRTGVAGDRSYLLVERYDRHMVNGRWRRRHQEDFLQALGLPPQLKYEKFNDQLKRNGPSLKDLVDVVRRCGGEEAVAKFMDYVAYNVLVNNTDAHAKNYSWLVTGQGVRLAPIYDVLNVSIFENIQPNLAQKIAGKQRAEHLKGRHWERLADECGLNRNRLLVQVEGIGRRILAHTAKAEATVAAMPTGRHELLKATRAAVEATARSVLAGLREVEPRARPADEDTGADLKV